MFVLTRNWWVLVLRGVLAVIFGILAYMWPLSTAAAFVILFGAYALVDGIFSLMAAIRPPADESRWLLVVRGVAGVLAAVVVFAWPRLSALAFLYIIAAWAIATGVLEIVAAVALRRIVTGEWLLALSGVLSIVLGVFLFTQPAVGLLGLVWAIALWAIIAGITLIILGFRLRSWLRRAGVGYGATP